MKYFVLISLLFSSLAFAKDYKLSKNEFLKKLDEGRVSLDKTPLNNIPEQIFPQLIQKMKQQYPDFQREMWYVAYIDSNNYRYFVFYEWYNRGCIFGIQETKKYGKNNADNWMQAAKEMQSYSAIDKKYCEQALGITLKKGGLNKIGK